MTIQSTSTQPHGRQSSVMIHDNFINKFEDRNAICSLLCLMTVRSNMCCWIKGMVRPKMPVENR